MCGRVIERRININLREARKVAGYSIAKAAIKTGLPYLAIEKIEKKGIENACIMDVAVLARFYRVPLFSIDGIESARYVKSSSDPKRRVTKKDYNRFEK